MLHDITIDVLEIFAEAAHLGRRRIEYRRPIHHVDAAWACGKTSRRRLEVRRERAASRPPCPHCKSPVVRCGPTAKIPKFCSDKCMRAARFARWHARHGAERNARRRAAPPNGAAKEGT